MLRKLLRYPRIVGIKGSIVAISAKLKGKMTTYEMSKTQIKYPFCLRLPSSDISTYRQIFMKKGYEFQVSQVPKVIIDAGANIGLASIYFSNKYPDAKIISIEAEKSNFDLLEQNVNRYSNITPVFAALWGEDKEINLIDPGSGKWGFRTQAKNLADHDDSNVCHHIQGITISTLMKQYNLNHVDILKVDIEGAEREVFKNADAWIDKVDVCIVELHDRFKPGCRESFYQATRDFENEWKQGENIYKTRKRGCISLKEQ